jgi:hypothetical protein
MSEALQAERDALARKLAKRKDQAGFASNAEAIEARIAEIDALLSEEPA